MFLFDNLKVQTLRVPQRLSERSYFLLTRSVRKPNFNRFLHGLQSLEFNFALAPTTKHCEFKSVRKNYHLNLKALPLSLPKGSWKAKPSDLGKILLVPRMGHCQNLEVRTFSSLSSSNATRSEAVPPTGHQMKLSNATRSESEISKATAIELAAINSLNNVTATNKKSPKGTHTGHQMKKGFRSSDNLADLITRIRNGYFRSFEDILVIDSKQNRELLDAFIFAGYIYS